MTPRIFSMLRIWLLTLLAAFSLTGCISIADIIAPATAEVGTPVQIKAQVLSGVDVDPAQLSYQWNFGDGATGTGASTTHVYQTTGEFRINLTVVDADGNSYPSKEIIIQVQPFTGTLVPISVRVYDATLSNSRQAAGPVVLQDATVTVAGQSKQTDEAGGALFNITQPAQAPVAIISKPGFITQAVTVPNGNALERGVVVQLKQQIAAVQIADVSEAQTVHAEDPFINTQAAKVVLPEQAFVNAAGEPVSGAATAHITPWNITNPADMAAFPGDRKAYGGSAGVVQLISFGMLTIDFEQGGQKLQLAPGKTAEISMDLPIDAELDGRAINVGDTIPLWHFNEARGLWEREGTGMVVVSDTSYTGLAVKATVSHFSSWNWDKVQDPVATAISRQVRCVVPDAMGVNQPIASNDVCVIQVSQTLPNGTVLTDSLTVPPTGSVFANFVSTANVNFSAEALLGGRRGTAAWQVNASEVDTAFDIALTQELVITVVPGDVPVVVEQTPKLDFHISLNEFPNFSVRPQDMKWWVKGADGTLAELPFKPYLKQVYEIDDGIPETLDYGYQVIGGGNAAGATMLGTLSGSLVAEMPVDKYGPLTNGQWGVIETAFKTFELPPIAPQIYSGPTLIRVPNDSVNDINGVYGLTFALWDEVGVSSPVKSDSIVEVSVMTVDGGWTSAFTPWLSTINPYWISHPNDFPNGTPTIQFKPYFTLNWDQCNETGLSIYGAHKVVMRVRVTDPVTLEQKIYISKPILIDFGGNGSVCT